MSFIKEDSPCMKCKHCFIQPLKATCYGDGYFLFPLENGEECDGFEEGDFLD